MRHDPYRMCNSISYNFMYDIANCVYVMQTVVATVYGKTFKGTLSRLERRTFIRSKTFTVGCLFTYIAN